VSRIVRALSGALYLQGVNLVLCDVEEPIPEGRDPFLIGTVPGLLPVPIRDGIQAWRTTAPVVTSLISATFHLLLGILPSWQARPNACRMLVAGPHMPFCKYSLSLESRRSIRTFTVVIDAPPISTLPHPYKALSCKLAARIDS
jgi:hypothetical protein